ncbi:ribosomal RNA small subunit methyltransferase nep-1 [Cucurbita pepo subsp. pepo]|uniref:ribosomal RNA small subunit methyltransferase nep-1 n=1 Tax=Cucurbita pepo subsp. pepo TaxID=3664 RepID=UPI000C9D663D|nr:ribosomal RNA small subunit methyltransferase nep-1 [Cucurbita pepo subsp. pepo]
MVRPFAAKGKKRKKTERYDRDDDGEESTASAKKAMVENEPDEQPENEAAEETFHELEGIPIVPKDPKSDSKAGVIFVLERASLEVAKVGKNYQLLNSDDHSNFLRRNNRNPGDYRPDILHQALLAIFDSRIAKAGRLKVVYVKTEKGLLIEIKPYVRLPRTQKRFYGVMLQLLQKLSITAAGKREKLFRVIKNPVTQYLPSNSRKMGFSHSSDKLVKVRTYLDAVEDDVDLVFVVGAMAHGKIETGYTDDLLAISEYPLSASCCIADICKDLADKWNVG